MSSESCQLILTSDLKNKQKYVVGIAEKLELMCCNDSVSDQNIFKRSCDGYRIVLSMFLRRTKSDLSKGG